MTYLALVTVLGILAFGTYTASSEFTSEFLNNNPRYLLLTCSTIELPRGTDVISIVIYNKTTSNILAWVTASEGNPMFSNGSDVANRFVSGTLQKGDTKNSRLQILFLNYYSANKVFYGCDISIMKHLAKIEIITLEEDVEVDESIRTASTTSPKTTTKELGGEDQLRTGSVVQQPATTMWESGAPSSVLIAMLVLIAALVVILASLLLSKFRARCCAQDQYPYPPQHYSLASETLDSSWEEKMMMKMGRPASVSAITRGHYSLPRPMPPPHHLRGSVRSQEYAISYPGNGRLSNIPGMTKVQYMAPYDAIAQDSSEDGDLSLLNTSRHDLTPSLSPEPTGEAPYKVPRSEMQEQGSQGQGHSLYSCVPIKNPQQDT